MPIFRDEGFESLPESCLAQRKCGFRPPYLEDPPTWYLLRSWGCSPDINAISPGRLTDQGC